MAKKVLVLGAYGGVGKSLIRNLLKYTEVELILAGRNLKALEDLLIKLKAEFPARNISSYFADASKKESLIFAFKNSDLVINCSCTPEYIIKIAEAALETENDLIDILLRGDIVDKLENYRDKIKTNKRIFIIQAGFHPGIAAPLIKYAYNKFEELQTANVLMVMNSLFENPQSTLEILHEVGENKAQILKNGIWKQATYKDAISVGFSKKYGNRICYPLQMREIYPLSNELRILNMGVYSAGFNLFVDNIVFPLIMISNAIYKGFGKSFYSKLMYWGVKRFYDNKPGIELHLSAFGIKSGLAKNYLLKLK